MYEINDNTYKVSKRLMVYDVFSRTPEIKEAGDLIDSVQASNIIVKTTEREQFAGLTKAEAIDKMVALGYVSLYSPQV